MFSATFHRTSYIIHLALISLEDVLGIDLFFNIVKGRIISVGDDGLGFFLELFEVVCSSSSQAVSPVETGRTLRFVLVTFEDVAGINLVMDIIQTGVIPICYDCLRHLFEFL